MENANVVSNDQRITSTSGAATTTTEPALGTATSTTGIAVVGSEGRGGSYVTLPVGSAHGRVEGTYVTVAGSQNIPPVTRGSYVTVDGAPTVAAGLVEGSYVTLSAAT